MELQKVNVKFFIDGSSAVPLTQFIEVFHSWIQATDGVYHDVADYSHMHDGPGIVLVANDANVSIDESGARRGLLFSQKTPLAGSNQDKLHQVLRAALNYCRKLEAEPALKGKLRFAANEAVISINDRLAAENSAAAFDALKGEAEAVAAKLFNGAATGFAQEDDGRRRLNLRVKSAAPLDVAQALANLQIH